MQNIDDMFERKYTGGVIVFGLRGGISKNVEPISISQGIENWIRVLGKEGCCGIINEGGAVAVYLSRKCLLCSRKKLKGYHTAAHPTCRPALHGLSTVFSYFSEAHIAEYTALHFLANDIGEHETQG